MHLSNATYDRLVAGSMPRSEALALAEHLDAPCEVCEAWLGARQGADGLDGLTDAVLLALAARPAMAPRDDLAFARVERELGKGRRRGAGQPIAWQPIDEGRGTAGPEGAGQQEHVGRRLGRGWAAGLAVAATLAVAGVAGLVRSWQAAGRWDGEKGREASAIPLRLRFAVVSPAVGGPPTLEKGISGQEVPAAASLQFQVEIGRPAHVLLARAGPGGKPEVFFNAQLEAGRHAISLGSQPAAYPLASLSGVQRFIALASPAPLGPNDAARAAALRVGGRRDGDEPITLDEVEVRIRP